MDIRVINDYFHVYMSIIKKGVSKEFFIVLLMILCIATVMSLFYGRKKRGFHTFIFVVLIEYITLIYCYTVFFRKYSNNSGLKLIPFWSYNTEATSLHSAIFIENVMNILIFVPIGFLLGCVNKDIGWKRVMVITVCISASIEILQFILHRGFTEVDDVIHNTLGAIVGFGLYSIFVWKGRKTRKVIDRKEATSRQKSL